MKLLLALALALGCSYDLPPRPTALLPDGGGQDAGDGQVQGQGDRGVQADTGTDTGTEAGTEAPPMIDAGPEVPKGYACDPQSSTGCGPTERCAFNVTLPPCVFKCVPAGAGEAGALCSPPLGTECARGFFCSFLSSGNRCKKLCNTTADCPGGFSCVTSTCSTVSWRTCSPT